MRSTETIPSRHILFVAFDGFQLLDLAGPMQVFQTASEHARDDRTGSPVEYRISVVSHGGLPVGAEPGLSFAASPLPDSLEPGSTLIAVGGHGIERAVENHSLVDWLQRHSGHADRVCSICNGAFLLAKAGLLAGKRATTHWIDCDHLQRRYPDVEVERDAIFVRDCNTWTSAGVSAGIDMALALVEADHGSNAAAVTARRLVLYVKRPGNQSQFSEFVEAMNRDATTRFGALHEWMRANINSELSVPALAQRMGMSERSFARKYRAVVGMTPGEVVNRFRAEAARQFLTSTAAPLKMIAAKSGFGSVEHMNRVHLKVYGLSSRALREIG
ncbi:MAG: AraC family transcriptional regulator [Nitratireductor sp.]|nr:AraC family transcriptional regulator [Nitratireductor sp.]